LGWDYDGADLLVGKELDTGVGEDTEQGGRVTAEETSRAFVGLNIPHGSEEAKP
jgi:hypothetical protein